jgi:hypothetical protein
MEREEPMPEGEVAAETMPEVEEAFEEIEVDAPLVGIIMGSKNDKPKMQPAGEILQDHGIRYEVRVLSAHRDPEATSEYCTNARMRGLKVIIAGAGLCRLEDRPPGDRRAHLGQEPGRAGRSPLGGPDAPRRAGRLRGDRRREERRPPRCQDHQFLTVRLRA